MTTTPQIFEDLMTYDRPQAEIMLESPTILEALTADGLRLLNYQFKCDHCCFLTPFGKDCRSVKQLFLNDHATGFEEDEIFHTYEQYLMDEREMEVFRNSLAANPAWMIGLAGLPQRCNIWDLLKLHNVYDGNPPQDMDPTIGIMFWRLFKRMFYSRVRNVLPPCIYKSLAHVYDVNFHHPGVFEDAICCLWKAFHPRVPLGKTSNHLPIFPETELSWRMYRQEGDCLIWHGNVIEAIPRIRAIETWRDRKRRKWLKLGLSYHKPDEIIDDDVTLPQLKMTKMIWNGIEEVPIELDEDEAENLNPGHMLRVLGTVAQGHIDHKLMQAATDVADATSKISPMLEEMEKQMRGTMDNLEFSSEEVRESSQAFKQGLATQLEELHNITTNLNAEMLKGVRGVSEETQRSIQELCTSLSHQVNCIGVVMQQGTAGLYGMIGRKTLLVCEAFALYVTKKYLPTYLWCCLLGLTIVRWFGLSEHLVTLTTWIYDTISQQFSYGASDGTLNPAHAEGEEDDDSATDSFPSVVTDSIAGVVFGLVNMAIFRGLPEKNKTEKFLKTIDATWRINRGVENAPKLFSWLHELVEKAIGLIVQDSIPEGTVELKTLKPKYEKWSADVAKLNRYSTEMDLEKDENLRRKILRLRDDGQMYVQLFDKNNLSGAYKFLFSQNLRLVADLAKKCEVVNTVEEFRVDPYCLWVAGKTRIGKSYLCDYLHMILVQVLGVPFQDSKYAMGLADHMDRYHGQPIVIIDDAGQWTGTFAEEKIREFMQMRTNHPMQTKQASLEDKGRVFTSKAIICSSNFTHPSVVNHVRDESAYLARRHLVLEAVLKVEYQDEYGQPDEAKIAAANVDGWTFPHLSFTWRNAVSDQVIKNGMTFAEVEAKIREEFAIHIERQNALVQKRKNTIYGLVQDRILEEPNPAQAEDSDEESELETLSDPFKDVPFLYLPIERLERPEMIGYTQLVQLFLRNFEHAFTVKDGVMKECLKIPATIWDAANAVVVNENGTWNVRPELEETLPWVVFETLGRLFSGALGRIEKCISADLQKMVFEMFKAEYPNSSFGNMSYSLVYMEQKASYADLDVFLREATGYSGVRSGMERFWNSIPSVESIREGIVSGRYLSVLRENVKTLAMVGAIVGVAIGAYQMVLKTEIPEDLVPPGSAESYDGGDSRTSRATRVTTVGPRSAPPRPNPAHSYEDPNTMELWENKFKRHMYVVECQKRRVNGLAFDGHNLLIPYHIIHGMPNGTDINLKGINGLDPIQIKLDSQKVCRLDSQDVVVLRDVRRLPPGPQISKYFAREKDLHRYKKFSGVLTRLNVKDFSFVNSVADIEDLSEVGQDVSRKHIMNNTVYETRVGFVHNAPCAVGDCGGILFAFGNKFERKAIGIHISGLSKGRTGGVCVTVTEDMLQKMRSAYSHDETPNEAHCAEMVKEPQTDSGLVGTGYILLGKTHFREFAATKTTIKESKLHGLVRAPVTGPSVLSAKDPRNVENISPFKNALTKYEQRTRPFHPNAVRAAQNMLHSIHLGWQEPQGIEQISLREVINGRYAEGYKAMDMDSSPGIPYKWRRPVGERGKKFLFEEFTTDDRPDLQYKIKDPELAKDFWDALRQLKRGERFPSVWVHCLKDERRKLSKIKDVKTRIFTMGSVVTTMVCRALTLHFTSAFYNNRLKSYSAVGIDAHSAEWSVLMRKLKAKGNLGCDGDYSEYDGTLDADLIAVAMDLMADWLICNKATPYVIFDEDSETSVTFSEFELRRAFKILATEFTHTVQLVLDVLHVKVQGNPSGNVLTVVINTIVGALYLRITWICLASKFNPQHMSLLYYQKYIQDSIYGDDNVISFHPDTQVWFNPKHIAEYLASKGIMYTTADKSGEDQAFKFTSDLRYLKRGWRVDEVTSLLYHAPIDTDTIYELTNWIRECPDEDEQLRTQLRDALYEARAHGYEFYRTFLAEVNDACKKIQWDLFPDEYETLCDAWRGQLQR
nr:MAG: polyprotein [Tuatara cloaca-associated picorna-like virus-1]